MEVRQEQPKTPEVPDTGSIRVFASWTDAVCWKKDCVPTSRSIPSIGLRSLGGRGSESDPTSPSLGSDSLRGAHRSAPNFSAARKFAGNLTLTATGEEPGTEAARQLHLTGLPPQTKYAV